MSAGPDGDGVDNDCDGQVDEEEDCTTRAGESLVYMFQWCVMKQRREKRKAVLRTIHVC